MAEFECKVYKLEVLNHDNADNLELVRIGDFLSVVQLGAFKTGDLGVYIPEGALVPEHVITELGLTGRLSGSQKNRVKAVRLRGVLSQGLVYPVVDGQVYGVNVGVGDDLKDMMGIEKYVPPVPQRMRGDVDYQNGQTLSYDIENIKKHPKVISEGDMVRMSEKIHGTWCCLGMYDEETPVVTSKGLSKRGITFKLGESDNLSNLYVNAWRKYSDVVKQLQERAGDAVYVLGEVYGPGVQDLQYGVEAPEFRAFDVYVGKPNAGRYLNPSEFDEWTDGVLPTVPVVYEGAFSKEELEKATSGVTLVPSEKKQKNMREGVVVKPMAENADNRLGRVILKSVSEKYLLRKNATEFE